MQCERTNATEVCVLEPTKDCGTVCLNLVHTDSRDKLSALECDNL